MSLAFFDYAHATFISMDFVGCSSLLSALWRSLYLYGILHYYWYVPE